MIRSTICFVLFLFLAQSATAQGICSRGTCSIRRLAIVAKVRTVVQVPVVREISVVQRVRVRQHRTLLRCRVSVPNNTTE